jgi:predicted O-methyltransferase YrrM
MFNWRFAKDYLLHKIRAKNRHGLHSPFVYRLVDEVIYDFRAKEAYAAIEKARTGLLADDGMITITDLGAGSMVNTGHRKKISDIARNSLKSPRLAQLLYRLVKNQHPANIIDLGTCLGITTLYLQTAQPAARLYTLEGCPETAAIATKVFDQFNARQIQLITGNFDDTLPQTIAILPTLDFLFVDGNHQQEATLRYFELCLPKLHENSLMIFDDIYWSRGMKKAWKQIKAHPQVSVTVDLFWIGLVFFKKGQVKQNFRIRF